MIINILQTNIFRIEPYSHLFKIDHFNTILNNIIHEMIIDLKSLAQPFKDLKKLTLKPTKVLFYGYLSISNKKEG